MTDNWNVGIKLSETEIKKLESIVEDLFESKAVNSKDIQDFLRFTVFIVFDEADKSKESLRKFYKSNLQKYNIYKSKK